MDQIKGKLTKMNPRKGFCNLILCFVIFCIIAGVGTMAKFGSRIPEMKKQIQIMENTSGEQGQNLVREKDGENREHQKDHEIDWENIVTLQTSDYVFIGCMIAVFWIILGIYWLYTTAYIVSKSWEVGANAWIFGVLTLVTNLFGVAYLWIYIKLHDICPKCGKLQPRKPITALFVGQRSM